MVRGLKSKNFYFYRQEYCKSGAFSRHGGGGGDFHNVMMQKMRDICAFWLKFFGVLLGQYSAIAGVLRAAVVNCWGSGE